MGDPTDSENETKSKGQQPVRNSRKWALRHHLGKVAVVLFCGVFLLIFFWKHMFPLVGPGEAGVMFYRFFGGTQTDAVVGEGQKFVFPWDNLYIYNVRQQERTVDLQMLSKEGLTLQITVSIRFHPEIETLGLLHQSVGPNYADTVVIPEVQMALLGLFGQLEIQQFQDATNADTQEAINNAVQDLQNSYLQVVDVVFRSVLLPETVRTAIEDKVAQKILASSYVYRQEVAVLEAARLEVDAKGESAANNILRASLSPDLLRWKGIDATRELAKSPGAKTVIIGNANGLPLILNPDK